VTEGDVLEEDMARTSTGLLWLTPAKAIVTAATSFRGEMPTLTVAGTELPVTVRHPASLVPIPYQLLRVRLRISLAPEPHVTVDPLRVSTKVSRTLPATVPAGTAVTAVAAWRDWKVVVVPTWEMAAAGVDASFGTVLMPAATTMIPAAAPMTLSQARESPAGLRGGRLTGWRPAM
jgi:hypothetical protein